MRGLLRVAALAGAFRRAGFLFTADPVELAADTLTPGQVAAIVNEPRLRTEITADGETWFVVPDAVKAEFLALAEATEGLSVEAFRAKLEAGELGEEIARMIEAADEAEGEAGAGEPAEADRSGFVDADASAQPKATRAGRAKATGKDGGGEAKTD